MLFVLLFLFCFTLLTGPMKHHLFSLKLSCFGQKPVLYTYIYKGSMVLPEKPTFYPGMSIAGSPLNIESGVGWVLLC